jgi:hypothetical protein
LSEKKKKTNKNQTNIFFYKNKHKPKNKSEKKGARHFSSLLGPDRPSVVRRFVGASDKSVLSPTLSGCCVSRHFDHTRRRHFSKKKNSGKEINQEKHPQTKNRQNPKHPLTPIQKDVLLILII